MLNDEENKNWKTDHDKNNLKYDEPERSHMEGDPYPHKTPCMNPEHLPPTHLHIPNGKRYIHICNECGKK